VEAKMDTTLCIGCGP